MPPLPLFSEAASSAPKSKILGTFSNFRNREFSILRSRNLESKNLSKMACFSYSQKQRKTTMRLEFWALSQSSGIGNFLFSEAEIRNLKICQNEQIFLFSEAGQSDHAFEILETLENFRNREFPILRSWSWKLKNLSKWPDFPILRSREKRPCVWFLSCTEGDHRIQFCAQDHHRGNPGPKILIKSMKFSWIFRKIKFSFKNFWTEIIF